MRKQLNIKKAVIFASFGALSYSVMAVLVKLVSAQTNKEMIVFFRFFISFIYLLIVLAHRSLFKKPVSLKTSNFKLHLLRATAGIINLILFYYSLSYINLLDASLLNTTYPLFIPILAFIFLRSHTHFKVWISLAIGFSGVVFILNPSNNIFHFAALPALGSGFAISIAFLTLRQLGKREHHYCIMFYYFLITTVVSGILIIFRWKTPDLYALGILAAIGLSGIVYQECITRASAYAPARIVSPLMYLNVIFSGLFGWMIWNNVPDLYDWIGVVLICSGAIMTVIFAHKTDMYKQIKPIS